MSSKYLLLMVAVLFFVSCKKDGIYNKPPTVDPPAAVLLKDVQISNLPSPYYHFEYNSSGRIQTVGYASGLETYTVLYNSDKIKEIDNRQILRLSKLEYSYDNTGRVNLVSYVKADGTVEKKVLLSYNGGKLTRLERQLNINAAFVTDKILSFLYDGQGNLAELTTHRTALMAQSESTSVDRFEQYDNKVNVDGFSLIHDEFFDLLILLPGVEFQKNNPGFLMHTGDGINFKIQYSYTYNQQNVPTRKAGEFTALNGPDQGKVTQINTEYSYY